MLTLTAHGLPWTARGDVRKANPSLLERGLQLLLVLALAPLAFSLPSASSFSSSSSSRSAAPAANVCGSNATLGAHVVSVVNLTYPGLQDVAAAAARGDLGAACEALAEYYAGANSSAWLRRPLPPPSARRVGGAVDAVVFNDIYDEGGLGSGRVPRNADGGLDWLYRGPRNDPEFENVLNRAATFTGALDAWSATGNGEYAAWLDRTIVDWATHNPCPGGDLQKTAPRCFPVGDGSSPACAWGPRDGPGAQACASSYAESPWRLLEQGARFAWSTSGGGAPWPAAFFGLQRAANFSTSARALAVLVAGQHLATLEAAGAAGVSNWAITQSTGLVTLALAFPELKGAAAARDAALANLLSLLQSGVYPDGVETEQASGYDMNTASDFLAVLQLLAIAGDASPPESFRAAAERMWTYGAYVADPAGCLPRNGDSDVCGSGYSEAAALYFNRTDWSFIRSNGKNGTVPPTNATAGPSVAFPWAGQVVMRSGYGEGATWAWLDLGPYGSSIHGHRDKLALNVHARGAMLLVDSGRFAYDGTDLPAILHVAYARNASAHNTLTFDGCDQAPEPAVATAPLPAGAVSLSAPFDEAFAAMSNYDSSCLVGAATHSRAVRFVRAAGAGGGAPDDGDYVVAVDVLASDRARSVQAHWHAHPNASAVELNSSTGVTRVGGARWEGEPAPAQVCIVPATGATGWASVSVVRGARPPAAPYQGWYSAEYDDAQPASTLVYNGAAAGGAGVWAWLLVPSAAARDCAGDSARVMSANATHVVVGVTLAGQVEARLEIRFALG